MDDIDSVTLSASEIVQSENDDKPHHGSKTPYIIFGLAIALIIIFAIAVALFFLLGNTPQLYTVSLVNTTGANLTINVNDFTPLTLGTNQTQIVYASPGSTLNIYGYNQEGGPYTRLYMWLSNQTYGGTPYVIINDVRRNAPVSNNTTTTDNYSISIVDGYNLAINVTTPTPGATLTSPTWSSTGVCPSDLLYPGTTGYYACQTPCYAGQEPIDYCCTNEGACGPTGTCTNPWIDIYTDFRNVCSGCNISNCDHTIFEGSNTQSGVYNNYVITFAPIKIVSG